jgi:glyoxylase-like metal-dependent hydrolase (beta-lactamase superfamily II)
VDKQSAVHHQPESDAEELNGMQALLTCPTGSIGTISRPKTASAARSALPMPIAGEVYYSGYSSKDTAACTSYFVRHPDGNILIDSPRFAGPLVKQLEAMGGIRYMYLTHIDHLGDQQKFRDHFRCERIIHELEKDPETWWDGTTGIAPPEVHLEEFEHQLTGFEPVELLPGFLLIPVPGHTRGHTVLLHRNKYLFSGDHLLYSPTLGHLAADRLHNWWSWPKQIE